jgi:homoserine dehydrogenase
MHPRKNSLTGQVYGWEVVLMNATMTNPEAGHRLCGRLTNAVNTGIRHVASNKRLAAPHPFKKITTAMKQERAPPEFTRRTKNFRSLP